MKDSNMQNILLAGIPRSGTTLACALLNRLPNVAALAEPMDVSLFAARPSPQDWFALLDDYFAATRTAILARGCAEAKLGTADSEENYFLIETESGLRRDSGEKKMQAFTNIRSPDFTLVIKHPNAFSAMLGGLGGRYPVYAMIRNPLAVLASWNSIEAAFRTGHAPMAEALCPALEERLARIADEGERQLALLSWYFEQYQRFLPTERIIRYEDMIASGGTALAALLPAAAGLAEPLRSKNSNPAYAAIAVRELAARLLDNEGVYWQFYSRAAVRELLASAQANLA